MADWADAAERHVADWADAAERHVADWADAAEPHVADWADAAERHVADWADAAERHDGGDTFREIRRANKQQHAEKASFVAGICPAFLVTLVDLMGKCTTVLMSHSRCTSHRIHYNQARSTL